MRHPEFCDGFQVARRALRFPGMPRHALIRFVTVSTLTLWASVATAQEPIVIVDPWSPDAAVGWRVAVVTDLIDPWGGAEGELQMVIVDPWKARPEDTPNAGVRPVDVTDPWAKRLAPTARFLSSDPENPW